MSTTRETTELNATAIRSLEDVNDDLCVLSHTLTLFSHYVGDWMAPAAHRDERMGAVSLLWVLTRATKEASKRLDTALEGLTRG
jgi:hypothetical protein